MGCRVAKALGPIPDHVHGDRLLTIGNANQGPVLELPDVRVRLAAWRLVSDSHPRAGLAVGSPVNGSGPTGTLRRDKCPRPAARPSTLPYVSGAVLSDDPLSNAPGTECCDQSYCQDRVLRPHWASPL